MKLLYPKVLFIALLKCVRFIKASAPLIYITTRPRHHLGYPLLFFPLPPASPTVLTRTVAQKASTEETKATPFPCCQPLCQPNVFHVSYTRQSSIFNVPVTLHFEPPNSSCSLLQAPEESMANAGAERASGALGHATPSLLIRVERATFPI